MSNSLLGFGIVALVAAIIGGGLKAFGFELPAVSSLSRQIVLAALGIILIVSAKWGEIGPEIESFLFPPVTETVGPITLEPTAIHHTPLLLSRKGTVDVMLQSVVPDWPATVPKGQHVALYVTICKSENFDCLSRQVEELDSFSRELLAGSGSIAVFNFGTNPRTQFTLHIKRPP
jgi:hypothetical protein